jgi:GTP-binding protein YchF
MRLGIIGLPSAGKTTLFNALTGGRLPTGEVHAPGKVDVHTAVADVPDERLGALSRLFRPQKTTPAKVTYADIGGLRVAAGREGLPGPLLTHLSQMDGFVHVVRAFEDPAIPHPGGGIDPARDLAALEGEFLLNDMLAVERRLERLREERQKVMRDRAVIDREAALFERVAQGLNDQQPLRGASLSPDEDRLLAGFGLLSRRPMLVVVNLPEAGAMPDIQAPGPKTQVLGVQGKLEMEIAQMPAGEAEDFLREYGIAEPGRLRVIRASYDLLDQHSFFTVGDDEVKAWTVRRGATAIEAADTIHSDLARGFIRAEVIPWDQMLTMETLSRARSEAKLRAEGKDYVVADGDIVHIKFNV